MVAIRKVVRYLFPLPMHSRIAKRDKIKLVKNSLISKYVTQTKNKSRSANILCIVFYCVDLNNNRYGVIQDLEKNTSFVGSYSFFSPSIFGLNKIGDNTKEICNCK